jgi:hypothetical protein
MLNASGVFDMLFIPIFTKIPSQLLQRESCGPNKFNENPFNILTVILQHRHTDVLATNLKFIFPYNNKIII